MSVHDAYAAMRGEADKVLVGQERVFELLVVSLLAGGHVLLEGVPGTAKTLAAKTLATLVSGRFQRVQFTPDLLPSDILGTNVFQVATGEFHLREGPIFCDVLLADEINRAPAKTQSALLEAMEERHATIDGVQYPLPATFMVVATQNPVEYEGTYPLPEAQLDRFLFKVLVSYADAATEGEVLRRYHRGFDPHDLTGAGLQPVLDHAGLLAARAEVQAVAVDDGIVDYTTRLVRATRESPDLVLGSSVRGAIALLLAAKALAAVRGRAYVVPDDVKELAGPALRHRVLLQPEAEIQGLSADDALERVLGGLEVPR
ncbi:MAG TPA: MoxR family ATPase [Chloroflexota bacterium]|nr:MoxR family ATPase [Chloroflexota bacterium]